MFLNLCFTYKKIFYHVSCTIYDKYKNYVALNDVCIDSRNYIVTPLHTVV